MYETRNIETIDDYTVTILQTFNNLQMKRANNPVINIKIKLLSKV